METDFTYEIALTQLQGVGPKLSKVLLSKYHSAKNIFSATKKDLLNIEQFGTVVASQLLSSKKTALKRAEEEMKYLQKNPRVRPIFYTNKQYPNRLKYCDDAPVLLYAEGNMNLNAPKIIAIVGTRKISSYGKKLISDLIYQLTEDNVVIISGLAYGVDSQVHKECVKHKIENVGVLAHGLDTLYPATNRQLAKNMVKNGGLLTEYLTNTRPNRENFPSRNRIIAGLADATIVIESDVSGGSLITADIAFSYHRDVFAFPGRVDDQYSSGCNQLIKTQKALLIENASDLYRHLGWDTTASSNTSRQRQLFVELSDQEQQIATFLQEEDLTAEQISVKCGMPLSKVRTLLLNLELKGVLRISPGNQFALN